MDTSSLSCEVEHGEVKGSTVEIRVWGPNGLMQFRQSISVTALSDRGAQYVVGQGVAAMKESASCLEQYGDSFIDAVERRMRGEVGSPS